MLKYKRLLNLAVFFFLILSAKEAYSFAGAYCANGNACTCGTQCKGGYEFSNLYNTIDGCPDGPDFNYEDVENVSIRALNSSAFAGGKTAEVTVVFKTTTDDFMRILYNNGSGFQSIFNRTCAVTGYETVKLNITINRAIGNHTLRAFINYPDQNYSGQTCGYNLNTQYSDTDDIVFYVSQGESTPPTISNISPNSTYSLEDKVSISANITDDDFVNSASVNITTPGGSVVSLNMSFGINDFFNATFSGTNSLGEYGYTIYAKDDSHNYANGSGRFYVDYTMNISVQSPVGGRYYDHTDIDFNITVIDNNYTTDTLMYELDGDSNVTLLSLHESYDDVELAQENTIDKNLSQSFNSTISLDVRKLLLKIHREGENASATVSLRNDSNGPGGVLAYGVINSSISDASSFQPVFLNQTANIVAGMKYWITISEGTIENFFYWSYGENYLNGESENDPGTDYLFYILDRQRYRANLTLSESNNLKIFVNNTAGVLRERDIDYYYDISIPYFVSADYLPVIEYGQSQQFRVALSDNFAIDTCLLEIDTQNLTMNREGLHEFNYSYPADQGPRTFRIYFNDSAGYGNNSEEMGFFVNDSISPVVNKVFYYPNSSERADPNATIMIYANVTDSGTIDHVGFHFGKVGESLVEDNMSIGLSGLYEANFTPLDEGIYQFYIHGTDEFGNTNTSSATSINASYDESFNANPAYLGVKGGIIGKNVSLGNITINNTGDYTLNLNLYKTQDTTPEIVYSQNPAIIPMHTSMTINITAVSPNIEAEYPIRIVANASFKQEIINATLFVQRGGAYLVAEFTDIPSKITLGNKGNNITAKITNIGNETADDASYTWILPAGWSTRNNLTGIIGTLISGAEITTQIKADIGDSAIIGMNTIGIFVNSSSNTSNLLEKVVEIESGEQIINILPSSQTQGGGVAGLKAPPPRISGGSAKATFDSATHANLTIGEQTRLEINITNNNKYITWSDFRITTEGFPINKISIEDDGEYEVPFQKTKRFFMTFDVPSYSKEEIVVLKIRLDAKQYDEKINLSSEVVFRKEISLAILKRGAKGERFCTEYAATDIEKVKGLDSGTDKLSALLDDAKRYIEDGRFEDARRICMEIKDARERAEEISIELGLMDQSIAELRKGYYDVDALQSSLDTAKNLFSIGNLDAAKSGMDDLRYALAIKVSSSDGSVKRIGTKVVRDYLSSLILGLMSASLIGTLAYSQGSKIRRSMRKRTYAREEEKIIGLVKKAQKEYYDDRSIGRSLYDASMKEYRERLARIIEKRLKIKIREEIEAKNDPSLEKDLLIREVQALQDDYYVKRNIDSKYYEEMSKMLNDKLYEIDVMQGSRPD